MDLQDRIDRLIEEGLPKNFYSFDRIGENDGETMIQTDFEYYEEELGNVEKELKRRGKSHTKTGERISNEIDWWRLFLAKPWKYHRTVEQFHCALEGWQAELVAMNGR